MIFDEGDWVRITREGVSYGRLGAIVGVDLYKGKPSLATGGYMYRVILLEMPDIELLCKEEDLERWTDYLSKKNLPSICECGGDKLEIPHHYDWCPKG